MRFAAEGLGVYSKHDGQPRSGERSDVRSRLPFGVRGAFPGRDCGHHQVRHGIRGREFGTGPLGSATHEDSWAQSTQTFPIVRVDPIPYSPVTPEEFDEWHEQLSLLIESRSTEWNDSFTQMADWVRRVEDPSMISDVVGYALVRDRKVLRELLAEENTKKRMSLLLDTLEEEQAEEEDDLE